MEKPCYRTVDAFIHASKSTHKIVEILTKSRTAILMLGAKLPDYWEDSHGDFVQMELVRDIEHLIKDLQNESS